MKLNVCDISKTYWFFDYDGSLCPHFEVWEEHAYDATEILSLLNKFQSKTKAQIFWNTGRRPESLQGVQEGFMDYSGYFIQGSFFWDAAKREKTNIGPLLKDDEIKKVQKAILKEKELKLEIKPSSLRVAPLQLKGLNRLRSILPTLPVPPKWTWHLGHRGAELLHDGVNKGSALCHALAQAPADCIPVAVGDDLLDKPAMEEAIRRNGYAVIVGGDCGWITEIKHKPDQVIFCDDPKRVHSLIRQLK